MAIVVKKLSSSAFLERPNACQPEKGPDKRRLEEPIPFHDFTAARQQEATMTRASLPSRDRPPLQKSSQSKLFKPFHVKRSHSRRKETRRFAIGQQQIGTWLVSALQEFSDFGVVKGRISQIVRILMQFDYWLHLSSLSLCLLTFALCSFLHFE